MCSHVCVLICLVSVLIMLIMPLSGVCLGDCLSVWHAFKAALANPPLTCACVCVCLCTCACMLAGMSVSAIKDGSGMLVRSVVQGGSVSQDGRLGVGDAILAINGEPASNLTNAKARAMLRRHSVIGPEMRWGASHCPTVLFTVLVLQKRAWYLLVHDDVAHRTVWWVLA